MWKKDLETLRKKEEALQILGERCLISVFIFTINCTISHTWRPKVA